MKFGHCAILMLASVAHGRDFDIRGGRTARLHERGLKSSKSSSKTTKSSKKMHLPYPPSRSSPSRSVSKSHSVSKSSKKSSSSSKSMPDICDHKDLTSIPKLTLRQTGENADEIEETIGDFRTKLGGTLEEGPSEITWDETNFPSLPDSTFPGDFFNILELSCDDCEFLVSGQPGSGDIKFNSTNPSASTNFETYSDPSLFATSGDTEFDIHFSGGTVAGFGVVFVDVDKASTTSVTYYDADGCVLAEEFADVKDMGLSFVGVIFKESIVYSIEINAGNAAIDETGSSSSSSGSGKGKGSGRYLRSSYDGDGKKKSKSSKSSKSTGKSSKRSSSESSGSSARRGHDVVVMDNFIYSEPIFKDCHERPLSDFLESQGSQGSNFFTGPPPSRDIIGWADAAFTIFAIADYAGVWNDDHNEAFGTTVSGNVTECKAKGNKAQISVELFAEDAFMLSQSITALAENSFQFFNTSTIFGVRPDEAINDGATPALGPSVMKIQFMIKGSNLPDVLDVNGDPYKYGPVKFRHDFNGEDGVKNLCLRQEQEYFSMDGSESTKFTTEIITIDDGTCS